MNKQTIKPLTGNPSPEPSVQELLKESGEASRYPLDREFFKYLGSDDIPFERYTSQEFFDLEMEKLWSKVWQWACRLESIPEVGDWVTYDIGDKSVIVVRHGEGPEDVSAYYNSCLHRGTKLCASWSFGSQPDFTCPYHGWQWNLDGTLKDIPNRWDFHHVEDEAFRLPEVRAEIWGGFVFINFDPDAMPLLDYLGVTVDHFKNWHMDQRYTTIHIQKELPCNWKAAAEAFMENYHTVITHPQLMVSSSGASTQYDVLDTHLTRFYALTGVPDPLVGELTEDEKLAQMLVGDSTTKTAAKVPEGETARTVLASHLRKLFDEEMDVEVPDELTIGEIIDTAEYTVFPNMFMFPGLSLPMVYRFRPIGNDPDQSLFDLLYLRPIPRSGEAPEPPEPVRITIEESYTSVPGMDPDMGHVYDQDTKNLGLQQEGFKAAGKKGETLGNYQEIRIRHLHQTIDKYLTA